MTNSKQTNSSDKKTLLIDKNVFEEYSSLIDLVSLERDKILGKYIISSNIGELTDYLDK